MKKLIIGILVFALAGTTVFAQDAGIKVGAWGRGVFEPLKYIDPGIDGVDAEVGSNLSTHWLNGAAAGVSFAGNAGKVGFAFDFRAAGESYSIVLTDNAYLWVKPADFLTIGAGAFHGAADFGLRGKVGDFGGFARTVAPYLSGEDAIFQRFGSGNGGIIVLEPVEGLTIGALFNAAGGGLSGSGYSATTTTTKDKEEWLKGDDNTSGKWEVTTEGKTTETETWGLDKDSFKKLQIGVGYQLPGIGLLRAQFVGGTQTFDMDAFDKATGPYYGSYNRIEAAFALTAIEGLTLDIGGKIPLKYTDNEIDVQAPISIAAGAVFGAGDLSIGGRVQAQLGGAIDKFKPGLDVQGLVEPSYNLGAFIVGGDVGIHFAGKDDLDGTKNDDSGALNFGLGAWIGLNFGNGLFRGGVAAQLPTTNYEDNKNPLIFSIPLVLQYSF
jgi:hypothetical protein